MSYVRTGAPFRLGSGLGAVRQYYVMPDAQTQAMIAAMGDTIEIVPNPNPTPQPLVPPLRLPPTPAQSGVLAPSYPQRTDYTPVTELCGPMDPVCIARNLVATTNAEVAFGQDQAAAFRAECLRQGNSEDVCAARWPAGYSGSVPATNVSPAQAAQDTYPVGQPATRLDQWINPATGTWWSNSAPEERPAGVLGTGASPADRAAARTLGGTPVQTDTGNTTVMGRQIPEAVSGLKSVLTGEFVAGIPNWAWLAALAAFLALKGHR